MQAALHAAGWALPRIALVLGILVAIPVILYVLLVVAIVVGQGAAAFGQ